MAIDKSLLSGSNALLILTLLKEKDMYGYQMIETLRNQSNNVFELKAGTLYPILHHLENDGLVTSYEEKGDGGRARKYYALTTKGQKALVDKEAEWITYHTAVNQVLKGGACFAPC